MILIEDITSLIPNQRLINLNDYNREYYFVSYKLAEYSNRVLVLRKHSEKGKNFLLTLGLSIEEFKENYVLPFSKNDFNKLKKIPIIKIGNRKISVLRLLSSESFNNFLNYFIRFENTYQKRYFCSSDIIEYLISINAINKNSSRKSLITTYKKYLNILEKRGFIFQNNNTFSFNEKYKFQY